jgi:riboflavin kinase/FMN adenylyltransferase
MRLIDGVEKITKKFSYPILTIGNFDGVHLGHQEIFRMITQRAHKKHGTAVVFTFEPHPLSVIAPERAPKLLTTFRDKISLIKTFGIDVTICANFTTDFAHIKAEDFARDILEKKVGVKEIYIGSNYQFGKGRKGTPELLTAMGRECGFTVKIIDDKAWSLKEPRGERAS